jgi:5'-nucleotidase
MGWSIFGVREGGVSLDLPLACDGRRGQRKEWRDMKRYSILMAALLVAVSGLTVLAPAQATVFDDVAPITYYADAALWAGTRGVSNGTGPGAFSPNDALTRADAVTLLWRALKPPYPDVTSGPPFFTDVPAGTYYRTAVEWAFYSGVTTGTTATTFTPNATITRAEFSTMLWRAYGSLTGDPDATFGDVPAGAYYQEAVNWMTAEGITTGTTPTTFGPGNQLTRAMGVTFLWRAAGEPGTFTLNVFHINDHHSQLAAADIGLEIGGSEVEFELGGFPRVVSAIDALRTTNTGENNMVVHAGDGLTGTLFYTLFEGEADAALMNEACFDILVPGNHEFDAGDAGFAMFLDFLAEGPCDTEVISANIVPRIGTPLAPISSADYLLPRTIRDFGGEKVGFVGITTAQNTMVSSSPLDTTLFLDEVATAQAQIDQLTAQGVDKIVVVTHYGYSNDLDLAAALNGVDAIVGGHSHTLLGDFDQYGLTSVGSYPTVATNADGDPVCIGHAWQYTSVVGELAAHFDEDGTVVDCTGSAHLLLGDVIENEDGIPDATIQAAINSDPQLMQIAPDAAADALLAKFAAEVDVLAAEVIGTVSEDLCLARFPYDGSRSAICDDADLPNGGDIQQLVTEAFLARAFRADVALQNSGGVRIDIPAGNISIADAYELLPFANTLFELDMTGAEIVLALEQGLSNVLDKGGSDGAYPYGAGIRWDVDATAGFGSRFSNVEVKPKGSDSWAPIDPVATYVVVANSFMGTGGDGYEVLADVVADGRSIDTFLDYAQSFIDYIIEDAGGVIGKPTEYSTVTYTPVP